MRKLNFVPLFLFIAVAAFWASALNSTPNLTKQPTLYVVAYAHLDTQWRWDYPQTINEYIPKTMHDNFRALRKVSALRLQLQWRKPLSHDEGILSGGLRAD